MFKYRWFMIAVTIIGCVVAVKYLLFYFAPFIIGMIIAAILDPLIDGFENRGWRRSIVAPVLVVLICTGFILAVAMGVAGLWREMEQLSTFYGELMKQAKQLEPFSNYLPGLPAFLLDTLPNLQHRVVEFLQNGLFEVMELITQIPNMLFTLMIAALTAYFICKDKRMLGNSLYRYLPHSWRQRFSRFKREVISGLLGYLRAQFMLVGLSGGLSLIGFFLIGIPYAWLLGILAGFLDLIPMIGPSGVFVPLLIYYLLVENIARCLLIVALWGFVLIMRQLWEPYIFGSQLGLHPLSSIVGIYLGVRVLGFVGFFIGPLAMIFLKALFVVLISDHYSYN